MNEDWEVLRRGLIVELPGDRLGFEFPTRKEVDAAHAALARLRAQAQQTETFKRERDNWHASNYAERQARLKAEAALAQAQQEIKALEGTLGIAADQVNESEAWAQRAEAKAQQVEEPETVTVDQPGVYEVRLHPLRLQKKQT